MDNWQKLILVLVEIWTDEDIKNDKWKVTPEQNSERQEASDEPERERESA